MALHLSPTPSGFVLFGEPSPQGHIKHEREGYLADVGQSHPFVTKPCGLGFPKRTNLLGVGLRCKTKNGEDPDIPQLMFSNISIKTFCKINKRVTQLPKKIVGPTVKKKKKNF